MHQTINHKNHRLPLNNYFVSWLRNLAGGAALSVGLSASITLFIFFYLNFPPGGFETIVFWLSVVFAGALNGLVYGYFQHRVLRKIFPSMTAFQWILPTTVGMTFGWTIAILPFIYLVNPAISYGQPQTVRKISLAVFVSIAVTTGIFVGFCLGAAQWFELRRHTRRSVFWILGNSVGWFIGLCAVYFAATFVDKFTPSVIIVAVCSVGGEVCGNFVSICTYFALSRMNFN